METKGLSGVQPRKHSFLFTLIQYSPDQLHYLHQMHNFLGFFYSGGSENLILPQLEPDSEKKEEEDEIILKKIIVILFKVPVTTEQIHYIG